MATSVGSIDQDIESKSELAYTVLEEMIVTMELAPGSVQSESTIAARLGLGRTPVREALQRLATENLVEIMPRRGIRITEISVKHQLRVLEARRALEELNVNLAVQRANPAQRQHFSTIADKFVRVAELNDYLEFVCLDREFNELLANSADNSFSAGLLQQLHGLSRRFYHQRHSQESDLAHVATLHATIARAIAKRDAEAAQSALTAQIDYIRSYALSTLGL